MPHLEPLGDQGILARCATEEDALRWAAAVRRLAPPWLLDVVQAYTAVAVFPDLQQVSLTHAEQTLARVEASAQEEAEARHHRVACCYERGPDLARVGAALGQSAEEVVRLHLSIEYRIFAIGFCPGFPYLGYLPPALCGVPRLATPRLRVEPGSVGITGRQTGIYPEVRPGGWNLIGQTPLVLVDVADGYFPLRAGDFVRFERIDEAEFGRLRGERL